MKILITGSEGYIGSVLAQKLIEKGYSILGIDSFFFGKHTSGMKVIRRDIRQIDKSMLKNIDVIIHLAALSNDPLGELNPILTDEINYKATLKLARLAKKENVGLFIFSSSCSVYGFSKEGYVNEKSKVLPLTQYARSKVRVEKSLAKLADHSFRVFILRNATVYGYSPNFRSDLVVNNFVANAITYKKIKLQSDGTPWRPLIDVRDLCNIFISFLEIKGIKSDYEIFNIGFNENNYQINDILEIMKKIFPDIPIIKSNISTTDNRSYRVNFDKFARKFPNIRQEWDLKKSIKDMIDLYRSEQGLDHGSRISVMKKLLKEKKINKDLYWNAM